MWALAWSNFERLLSTKRILFVVFQHRQHTKSELVDLLFEDAADSMRISIISARATSYYSQWRQIVFLCQQTFSNLMKFAAWLVIVVGVLASADAATEHSEVWRFTKGIFCWFQQRMPWWNAMGEVSFLYALMTWVTCASRNIPTLLFLITSCIGKTP